MGRTVANGYLHFVCVECSSPLFTSFVLTDGNETIEKTARCPGCHSLYTMGVEFKKE
jgi:DNA-directed RNA polymerase subunit RPC12/RpoP